MFKNLFVELQTIQFMCPYYLKRLLYRTEETMQMCLLNV